MLTLTSDKLAPIEAGFSIKYLVHQGHRQSTPKQTTYPEGLTNPQNGSLRPCRPIQCDRMGWHLSEGIVPSPASYSSSAGIGSHIGPSHLQWKLSDQAKRGKNEVDLRSRGTHPPPPRKAVLGHTSLCSTTGWDNACQKALYPCLPATVHRLVQVATYPHHIPSPREGNMAAPRIAILGPRTSYRRTTTLQT
jgi:hypothetical protein